ncbi:class I SAM-dependent methyltransferase [Stakelama tenebrarum]|uniref:Class I SAM-dependent methyltransferase n=1 Tax=Stakelama tenebrarum TaxID=2711215 RepID=A0A6G6Y4R3_9SPHN|nr:class I SAM-dependent methyltransferase [Sphingosinithalassobacter tenebrarum]QIG79797.1 class I SAM-dependent methyltransferase [Sphingosinithalassobacter tenebrarum]
MQEVLDGYAAAASDTLIATYDALSSEEIYRHVADLFPREASRVADIGAGTGRDAAWFAARGHRVTAVEPVRELREAGRALHGSAAIDWVDDRLPHLTRLVGFCVFDLVTLCGVWQHLPDPEQDIALAGLAAIIAPDGLLVMSLRHGPGAAGRPVFPADPDAMIAAAQALGFQLIRRIHAPSVQPGNRVNGVHWTWLALRKSG